MKGPAPKSLLDRYWEHAQPSADPDACWGWNGEVRRDGYGQLRVGSATDNSRRNMKAHRLAYLIHHGEIPSDKPFVLHSCDNPICTNGRHLFAGTHQDNMRDMATKKRSYWLTKTHCPQGHAYDDANTIHYQGRRYCRSCRRLRQLSEAVAS